VIDSLGCEIPGNAPRAKIGQESLASEAIVLKAHGGERLGEPAVVEVADVFQAIDDGIHRARPRRAHVQLRTQVSGRKRTHSQALHGEFE